MEFLKTELKKQTNLSVAVAVVGLVLRRKSVISIEWIKLYRSWFQNRSKSVRVPGTDLH